MNELSELIKAARDGDRITLENRIYEVAPEDGFHLKGFFFSNTAKQDENPDGERFCAIYLENKSDIVIDGNGAVIMLHGKMTPFIFCRCRNIVLKNIGFDHYRPTMSEFTVTKSAPGTAEIRINDEFRYTTEGNMLYWCGDKNKQGEPYWQIPYKGRGVLTNAFDPSTGVIDDMICGEGDSWGGFPDIEELTETEKGVLQLRFRDKNRLIPAGTVAQTRSIKRVQTGGAIDRCSDVTLENLRIFSMNCFGILAQNSCNLLYTGLDCTPKKGRTVVSDADFFHFSGCSGEVRVINCKAKGAHDDIINIHGTHLKIININRETGTVIVRYSHPESWGFEAYAPGDRIEYVCGNTLKNMGAAALCVADDANFWFESGRSGNITFENNTVINCAARYAVCGDDVIRYEPVVLDKSSTAPVHKRLVVKNNRFISGTGRNYIINLNYLAEAQIEGNTSDKELIITK